jgi:pseudaminic acid synthase
LKCTSSYPAPIDEANLLMMQQYKKDFNVQVGISDHTLGSMIPIIAVAMGAKVIEKHFILDKTIGGLDSSFSLDFKEFSKMVTEVRLTEKSLGKISYDLTEKQISARQFSRSLYVSENIKKGELITKKNIKSIRPGFGLHPKYFNQILGKKFIKNIKKGTRLNFKQFK